MGENNNFWKKTFNLDNVIESKSAYPVKSLANMYTSLLVFFEGSKINLTQVAIFDKNMAVEKSENLIMLHPYELTQPFFRGYSDLALNLFVEVPTQLG